MTNVLLNYQTNNLRYAIEELKDYNLYAWRMLGHNFAQATSPEMSENIIEHVDFYEEDRSVVAEKVKAFMKDKKIDFLFPLYSDMMFPHIADVLGFTEKQTEILSNKEAYTEIARSLGIPVPRTYRDIKKAEYPIIAKPVNGTASIGVKVLKDYSDYFFFASGEDVQYNDLGKYYIFQDFIDGMTVSAAGRIVDGEILFDISYTIESSDLPYRAETGFILMPNLDVDDILKVYIARLIGELKLDNCAWMADFIYSNGEFFLVDFSPRLSVSAQVMIKYSADVDYNKMILKSILYKDKTKVNLKKCVVYRYFDLPKGRHNITFRGDITLADELKLPRSEVYLKRVDLLMPFSGYAVTSGDTLQEAENKFQKIASNIIITELE
jgi:predicted ATP-grasp superfamily ATP-dependent carboligase